MQGSIKKQLTSHVFSRDYESLLRLEQGNVELHMAITARQNAARLALNGAANATEEMAQGLEASREDTANIRVAMEQCERQLRMAQNPVGICPQLQQQQIIGEVFGEALGGIRMETVHRLRGEALDLRNSLQEKDAEIKRLSKEAWKAKSETSLVQANLRGKSAEWEQKGGELRAAVAAEKKRANDTEMQLSDQTWIWNQEIRDLETALEKENQNHRSHHRSHGRSAIERRWQYGNLQFHEAWRR
ncbi:hypothetical protein VF21_07755 [Pseudogymnoascus sp. 05NY08]|nr:hypothetical protein VF21_07755 [Pseudogymnoascus sp. 05NY08]